MWQLAPTLIPSFISPFTWLPHIQYSEEFHSLIPMMLGSEVVTHNIGIVCLSAQITLLRNHATLPDIPHDDGQKDRTYHMKSMG